MEWLVAGALAAFLGFLLYQEVTGQSGPMLPPLARKRLCDYTTGGSVWEDPSAAIARGTRLLEVHVYSDERDQPVVALKPLNEGYDYAEENVSFESVCVAIANDAFPSPDPFILSIVPHTHKTVVMDRVTEHLMTTVRKHLVQIDGIAQVPIDRLANALIIVGAKTGSTLDEVLNLDWTGSQLRRLSYSQALHPRDPSELMKFARDHLVLVAPDAELKTINANPDRPKALGCQWNVYDRSVGFSERV